MAAGLADFAKFIPTDLVRGLVASGMRAESEALSVVSDNIANVNTAGFKKSQASFEDLFYVTLQSPGLAKGAGDAAVPIGTQIGSGTRLAMEDAVALAKALREHGSDVPAALAAYQTLRLPPMKKIWDAANVSLRWYEHMDEHMRTMTPVEFAYSYMTRTGRVSHADVQRRDPALAEAYARLHPEVLGGLAG